MKELQEWMKAQLAEHRTEPNSGLGKAISYLLNHWTKLTLFLSQPGAPIGRVEMWRGGLGSAYLFPAFR
jgi:transposase